MSINIPEGYEIQYLIRKPDGTLVLSAKDQPAYWSDRSECEQMLKHLAEHAEALGITNYLATVEVRLCSPVFALDAPFAGFVDEIERWRKSTGGQA
ncbi:hypothetical protein R2362_09445 [Mycobacteroides chelonae]|jgi:hypothetical protein|uniref:hypothetical protein n=1 Tax=Mycobacteroides TaxID=670516 RepID=UPI000927AD29|nr:MULTISPECIES: hypothetical protein [Mycobacteroides]MDM2174763.1 hypothetical protein [Mycobacteroides abscessus]MDM2179177.1 hypothetical protein [Mycobacteroides abscessus]MDM2205565.1 hypothetical protein [Mycobacteroides abscessus]MDM2212745.1 hypothetical protein [Mycobacteroides abscessus]MDM2214841.1 hypothetical protein [Mycobacteroides abscessus]